MNVGLLAGLSLLGLNSPASYLGAQPRQRQRWKAGRYDRSANSRVKSLKEIRQERREIRDRQNALTLKYQLDQQQRAKVAGCHVMELHNKKNRWVLNDAKFNAALQA